MYRLQGKKGCPLPNVRTQELNRMITALLPELRFDRQRVFSLVLHSLQQGGQERAVSLDRLQKQERQLQKRKEKLLTLYLDGDLSKAEFQEQKMRYAEQLSRLHEEIAAETMVQEQSGPAQAQLLRAMEEELTGILHEEIAAVFLEKAVICADSSKETIHVQLFLRQGQTASVFFSRNPFTLCRKPFLQCAPPNADCAR